MCVKLECESNMDAKKKLFCILSLSFDWSRGNHANFPSRNHIFQVFPHRMNSQYSQE